MYDTGHCKDNGVKEVRIDNEALEGGDYLLDLVRTNAMAVVNSMIKGLYTVLG